MMDRREMFKVAAAAAAAPMLPDIGKASPARVPGILPSLRIYERIKDADQVSMTYQGDSTNYILVVKNDRVIWRELTLTFVKADQWWATLRTAGFTPFVWHSVSTDILTITWEKSHESTS